MKGHGNKSVKVGPASPSKEYRKAGTTSYGGAANVRESHAKSWDKAKKGSTKAGAYASYS